MKDPHWGLFVFLSFLITNQLLLTRSFHLGRLLYRFDDLLSILLIGILLCFSSFSFAKDLQPGNNKATASPSQLRQDSQAEAQLIYIYSLIGAGKTRQALAASEKLVKTFPNFQLAHLVHGDLLSSLIRPLQKLGDVPNTSTPELNDLREESLQRIKALKERPPADSIPSQFLTLSKRNKHAIAVDTSRSRLYLFKNDNSQLRLIADFYISVGKLGVEKSLEGDQRTPLGVYFITSSLNPKSLKDLYGTGALPINYPNPLDTRRGKTGSGIWLHGTPSNQFSRAPKASDGCVVLANPDLNYLLKEVSIRTTPVVISEKLEWVQKTGQKPEELQFVESLQNWRLAKSNADFDKLMGFYSNDFSSYDKNLVQWASVLGEEVAKNKGSHISLSELSMIRWVDKADTMVVTFDELADKAKSGETKRQYWTREGKTWKIFFEGVI